MPRQRNVSLARRYADELATDTGVVRLSELSPDATVTVRGRTLTVGDIPLTTGKLTCAHATIGIALAVGDTIYCEQCEVTRNVVTVKRKRI